MLNNGCHIIATMRTKTQYEIEKNDKGKIVPRKIGLSPIQRNGTEYEFPFIFNIDETHRATVDGNQTLISFGGEDSFLITKEVGEKFKKWLNTGAKMKNGNKRLEKKKKEFFAKFQEAGNDMKDAVKYVQGVIGKNAKEVDLTVADYTVLEKSLEVEEIKETEVIPPQKTEDEPHCKDCGQVIDNDVANASMKNFGTHCCVECAQNRM